MNVVVSGASGLVGSALQPVLRRAGHNVFRLVRGRPVQASDEIGWDPGEGTIDRERLEACDAIINLAGETIGRRWSAARRERILRSRVEATRTLVAAVAKLARKPAVFINASAVGYYGDRGDETLTEASGIGHGFLSEVCLAWETHAEGAGRLGVRTAVLRFGMILARTGGALGMMRPFFRAGLGGPLGHGRQWLSWVSIDDVAAVITQAIRDPRYEGALNVVAPNPVTNAEFARALGRALHRPAVLPAPAWALRMVFGRAMADETLLVSARAIPERLRQLAFRFQHPSIESALAAVV